MHNLAQKQLTGRQMIDRAINQLMRSREFMMMSGVLMMGETYIVGEGEAGYPDKNFEAFVEEMGTACTNGWDTFYCSSFLRELSDKERNFVVMHETMHKALKHMFTWERLFMEDPETAGAACDYVINLAIHEADPNQRTCEMPRTKDGELNGLYDEQFRGMDAGEVYRMLKQSQKDEGDEGEDGDSRSGQSSGKPVQGKSRGKKGHDAHMLPDKSKQPTAEEKERQIQQIERALRQGQLMVERMFGKGEGGMGRAIDQLLEAKVNWREELRAFVAQHCRGHEQSSWRRVNKRYRGLNLTLPTAVGEGLHHLVVAPDTSGSVGIELLTEFVSELREACITTEPEITDILWWDGAVSAQRFLPDQYEGMSAYVSATGGGGTDPSVVTEYIREKILKKGEKVDAVIMMTDGYVPNWGDWSGELEEIPVLWLVRGANCTAPHGRCVTITD